ncbi:LamG domain-containing protein [bacterium]|nr:LamG domain-containing protein [bacterium]
MKTRNWIIILVVVGLIALGGGYMLGLSGNDALPLDKSDNVTEEIDDNTENASGDNVVKSDTEEDNKEDVLEKEDASTLTIEEGLIAYYPFNEDIKDYSGEEIDATNHNAFFVDGKKGKALKFNGKNSYVHVPININPVEMPQITIAVWAKAEKGSIVVRQIIGNDNDEYDRTIVTDFRGGGKGWSCFAGDGRVLGYDPVVADKWTFIAAVYDQDAGTVKLFVDGSVYEKDGKMVDEGTDFILIGARGLVTEQSHYFNGAIDEVKIYDYALSDEELNSLYKNGTAQPISE